MSLHCFLRLFVQKLKNTESDRLSVQVNAYLDNMIDVATLLEDSDTKTAALEKVADLEEALSHVSGSFGDNQSKKNETVWGHVALTPRPLPQRKSWT